MNNIDVKIQYLAELPDLIPILAKWTYDAWAKYDPSLSLEVATKGLQEKLNKDKLPLTFVAIHKHKPVGMVTLKPKIKVAGYTDRPLWLGSFWVIEEARNQGIGALLLTAAYDKARKLGFKQISLFASDPQMVDWYLAKGWQKFATDTYQDHTVTLLEYSLN